ncbi:uncharacterized protein LOC128548124 [Mercenaria mercenaria]|uniref:uncharacterized protein LOC128548124 n=1 Tax=Mercenaria mercenaria TaxID=6596 RepID=UPI00234F1323|nr:uncharacterized protein LOC128548124 [Mercenaria mercenaria]
MSRFKSGNEQLQDLPKCGRLKSVTTRQGVMKIKELIEKDARLTLRELAHRSGISAARVHFILRKILKGPSIQVAVPKGKSVTANNAQLWLVAVLLNSFCIQRFSAACSEDGTCCNKFECEYNVLLKLIQLEEKTAEQENKIESLTEELKGAKDTIAELNETILTNERSTDGTTYIRWGRTVCPSTAFLVYNGYVAGAHYSHTGTAVDPLCLPRDPNYDQINDGFQNSGRLYGAEYETNTYSGWSHLHDHEIPCAVCRIPRNNVLMVPGKSVCHENYILEYKGYLMSAHYGHNSPSEFICVDDLPEMLEGGQGNQNGQLFYFVEGVCGSLQCPPYKDGWELTCAVCSFSPGAQSTKLQPYI